MTIVVEIVLLSIIEKLYFSALNGLLLFDIPLPVTVAYTFSV